MRQLSRPLLSQLQFICRCWGWGQFCWQTTCLLCLIFALCSASQPSSGSWCGIMCCTCWRIWDYRVERFRMLILCSGPTSRSRMWERQHEWNRVRWGWGWKMELFTLQCNCIRPVMMWPKKTQKTKTFHDVQPSIVSSLLNVESLCRANENLAENLTCCDGGLSSG